MAGLPSVPEALTLRVSAVDQPTALVRGLRLVSPDGAALPGFAPGAHVQVAVPSPEGGAPAWRSYSLIRTDGVTDAAAPVDHYRIAVRREDEGRGGSRFMHTLAVGDTLPVRPPVNHFVLEPAPTVLLIAGGIGITPLVAMADTLAAQGRDFRLHYAGRQRAALAYLDELRARFGERLVVHADDEPATALSVDALLGGSDPRQPVYVCGPAPMIDAVIAAAKRLGWRDADVHFERFAETAPLAGDQPFEVTLARDGRQLTVGATESLLEALARVGVDVMYDCRAGYCGLCQTGVRDGAIDHRDSYLSDADKAGGRIMQVCVSRACAGSRLILDL